MRNQRKQRVFQGTGIAFIAVGLIFLAVGLLGLGSPVACSINGCPSITSAYYTIYWDEIYARLGMIALGIGLLLGSFFIPTDGK